MSLILWSRRAAAVAGPAALVFFCSSSARLDPFVASGAYADAYAAAADCQRIYVPSFSRAEDSSASENNSLLPRFTSAGTDLAYAYRPSEFREVGTPGEAVRMDGTSMTGEAYMPLDADETERLKLAPGARVDRVEGADWAATVTSEQTQAGCVRLMVIAATPTIQVGIPVGSEGAGGNVTRGNGVITMQEFSDLAYAPGDPRRNRYYNERTDANLIPAVNPDTVKGQFIVRAYQNGTRVPHLNVVVYMDPRGNPGVYGRTYPHNHLLKGLPNLLPSVRIASQVGSTIYPRGTAVTVQTNEQGEASVPIRPGYRGGPEALIASTVFPGRALTDSTRSSQAVVVRHRGGFVSFAQAVSNVQGVRAPATTNAFPFILTGWTVRHANGLFVRADKAREIASMFMEIWAKDPGRRNSTTPRYVVFNDMSLEYGGLFKLADVADCDVPTGAHATHIGGIDFDVSPCYSEGANGMKTVGSVDCMNNGGHLKINEAILASLVLGSYNGAIIEHRPSWDNTPYHYHVRFPDH